MMSQPENLNYAFAGAFVEELARSGLRHACICPGSRSTPLAISLARHPKIKTWIHLDERSGSFFALGMARALREPVAVLCTSGTAAANFFPAVVEAKYAGIPLLLLTSDRPPELWEWGANQAIDQTRMYGPHAKWSVSMSTPEATPDLLRSVRALASRTIATAIEAPAGPVHINLPFREPLAPEVVLADHSEKVFSSAPEAWLGREGEQPYAQVKGGQRVATTAEVTALATSIRDAERGLIVCGPQDDPEFAACISLLAAKLGYPVLADPLSQVRCGAHDRQMVIDNYDALLRDNGLASALPPQVVLRFGAIPTSKVLLTYLEQHRQARQVVIGNGGWHDPIHAATDFVQGDATQFARDLSEAIPVARGAAWPRRWLDLATSARRAITHELDAMDELFEGKVIAELASMLPPKVILFAGNSMPVRDVDSFFPSITQQIRFMANRGASGIDGVVSSALGASAVLPDPLVLVLGDLSFYHDMNGLLAAKQHHLNATIIVINNDGGGIFSFLPLANYPEYFEQYFGTPHGLTFEQTASLYGIGYSKVTSWREFRAAVSESIGSLGTTVVEIPGERVQNVQLHNRVWSAVARAIRSSAVKQP